MKEWQTKAMELFNDAVGRSGDESLDDGSVILAAGEAIGVAKLLEKYNIIAKKEREKMLNE